MLCICCFSRCLSLVLGVDGRGSTPQEGWDPKPTHNSIPENVHVQTRLKSSTMPAIKHCPSAPTRCGLSSDKTVLNHLRFSLRAQSTLWVCFGLRDGVLFYGLARGCNLYTVEYWYWATLSLILFVLFVLFVLLVLTLMFTSASLFVFLSTTLCFY